MYFQCLLHTILPAVTQPAVQPTRSAFSGSLTGQTLSGNLLSAGLANPIFGLLKIGHNIL